LSHHFPKCPKNPEFYLAVLIYFFILINNFRKSLIQFSGIFLNNTSNHVGRGKSLPGANRNNQKTEDQEEKEERSNPKDMEGTLKSGKCSSTREIR
jgi:hypothetical protein